MSQNMTANGSLYKNAADAYKNAAQLYTGNAGYQNSLNQAKKGAGVEAVQAGNQAQTQARSSGMSKAAAALMGANNASNSYLSSFNNQQNQAAQQGNSNLSAAGTNLGSAQTENQNRYNRAWGNVGTALTTAGQAAGTIGQMASLFSDKRLKDAKEVGTCGKKGKIYSDERIKIYQEITTKDIGNSSKDVLDRLFKGNKDLVDLFSTIKSYEFKYKPEAQKELEGCNGMDADNHCGVMAQDLEKNPLTASAVSTDNETGFKTVDPSELTMANTSVLAEVCRKLKDLEEKVGQ